MILISRQSARTKINISEFLVNQRTLYPYFSEVSSRSASGEITGPRSYYWYKVQIVVCGLHDTHMRLGGKPRRLLFDVWTFVSMSFGQREAVSKISFPDKNIYNWDSKFILVVNNRKIRNQYRYRKSILVRPIF